MEPEDDPYDVDARVDPYITEYERARDLLHTSEWLQGVKALEELAYRGSIMSILLVADAMRIGWIYDRDLSGAEAWYRVAIDLGSARGIFGLGLTHLQMGRFAEARHDLEMAIERNYPPALNSLAGIYFRGDGVSVDKKLALELWRRGASLGHIPAKRNIMRESLNGRLGPWNFIRGLLKFVPIALEIAKMKEVNQYSDRLR